MVDCALRRLFHSVLSLRQPSQKTVTGALSLNGAEECAGGVGGRYPLHDGKAK
ncbi:bicyclomycin resistance protein, partial [Salmonella enterica]|nr:bicyclomycin resistance protein [Salmonella enterica]ECS1171702.1 bicyclomycin resistance protein [Salmonella enterica]